MDSTEKDKAEGSDQDLSKLKEYFGQIEDMLIASEMRTAKLGQSLADVILRLTSMERMLVGTGLISEEAYNAELTKTAKQMDDMMKEALAAQEKLEQQGINSPLAGHDNGTG